VPSVTTTAKTFATLAVWWHNMTELDLLNALHATELLAEYIRKQLTEKGL
jgi:hypothetical protein